MALPSSPVHGQIAVYAGSEFIFDSDIRAWTVSKSATQQNLDSDILDVRVLFTAGAQSAGFPVGAVVPFTINNLPAGFVLADGSTFNTTLYPELYDYFGTDVLPDYTNRVFGFKAYDYNDERSNSDVVFGIAGYNGAGVVYDSDIINAVVEQQTANLQDQINTLKSDRDSDTIVIQSLREDLSQAVADRVFTDNNLSARLDGHDSDLETRGRFYVQSTPPSGGPNSGWVNTTNMRLHVWDESVATWIEVTLT